MSFYRAILLTVDCLGILSCRPAEDKNVQEQVTNLAARINLSFGVKPPKGLAISLWPLITSHRCHKVTRIGYSPAG